MSPNKPTTERARLASVGLLVTRTYHDSIAGGTEWTVHFMFASELMSRSEAKIYASLYILEAYGVEETIFFAHPDRNPNQFYARLFTTWRP